MARPDQTSRKKQKLDVKTQIAFGRRDLMKCKNFGTINEIEYPRVSDSRFWGRCGNNGGSCHLCRRDSDKFSNP